MSADTSCTHKYIGIFDAGENLKLPLICKILIDIVNYYHSIVRNLMQIGKACHTWR
jgi:hypothetical protein